jgi:hypothetical protein
MKNLFIIAAIAVAFAFSAPLLAQGRGGGKGGYGKGGYGKGGKMPSKEDIDKWRKGQNGGGGNEEGGGWLKKRIDELGWGENGDEERVEPGDTVSDDEKEARLKEEAAKLGLEDEDVIDDLVKYAKRAWEKAEREDSKLAKDYKKHKDDPEDWEKDLEDHKKELEEIWADCDEDLEKKEVIAGDTLEEFKKNTKDIRETTATMKSAEQDEIRERKIEELRKQAEDWAKGGMGTGGGGDNEEKKEKKEEEEE